MLKYVWFLFEVFWQSEPSPWQEEAEVRELFAAPVEEFT